MRSGCTAKRQRKITKHQNNNNRPRHRHRHTHTHLCHDRKTRRANKGRERKQHKGVALAVESVCVLGLGWVCLYTRTGMHAI